MTVVRASFSAAKERARFAAKLAPRPEAERPKWRLFARLPLAVLARIAERNARGSDRRGERWRRGWADCAELGGDEIRAGPGKER